MPKEIDLKRWFRANWKGWFESYEPRRGSGVGLPDTQIAIDGLLCPIELKLGEIDPYDVVWSYEVRPDQIGWHKRAALSGIATVFLIGCGWEKKTPKRIILVDGVDIRHWQEGLEIGGPASEINHLDQINEFVRRARRRRSSL